MAGPPVVRNSTLWPKRRLFKKEHTRNGVTWKIKAAHASPEDEQPAQKVDNRPPFIKLGCWVILSKDDREAALPLGANMFIGLFTLKGLLLAAGVLVFAIVATIARSRAATGHRS
jgi:hypothetical protein